MITSATLAWVVAGIVAAIGAALGKYLSYRYGRQVEENANKDAKLKTVLEMHNVSKKVAADTPANDDAILARLSGKD